MLVTIIKTYIIKNLESEKSWKMSKLLAGKLNLAHDKTGQKEGGMLTFFKGIIWEAAYFQESLYKG